MAHSIGTEKFIERSKLLFGNKFDYSFVDYVRYDLIVDIVCPIHGLIKIKPKDHLTNSGCFDCKRDAKYALKTQDFIIEAANVHNDRYDYGAVRYSGCNNKIEIICNAHGSFAQLPHIHLGGSGCPNCARKTMGPRHNIESFTYRANKKHKHKYDYSNAVYGGCSEKVEIICPEHGVFAQVASYHLAGNGCQKCAARGFSQMAINWIESMDTSISHAANGGEYIIPGIGIKVDGYCRSSNTVYEFYGDVWHGNPDIFKDTDRCHPFTDVSAKELYDATIKRENKIKDMGYNIVTIWQKDYEGTK